MLTSSCPPDRPHRHSGWFCCEENLEEMHKRMDAGECVVVDNRFLPYTGQSVVLWCITHRCRSDYGHNQDMEREKGDQK